MRKLPRGPELSELHQLLSQAMENRGKVILLSFRTANMVQMTLEVCCNLKQSTNAQWALYVEQSGKREVLFEYSSVDVLLVFNKIGMFCSEVKSSAVKTFARLPAQGIEQAAQAEREIEKTVAPQVGLPVSSLPKPSIQMPVAQPAATPFPEAPSAKVPPPGETVSPVKVSPIPVTKPIERPTVAPASQSEPAVQFAAPSFASSSNIVVPPPKPEVVSRIPRDGDLKDLPVTDLLEKIFDDKGTGRLDVRSNDLMATVFIQDGFPVDATAGDVVGDEAMIELLTWQEGTFTFEPRVLRNNHTVYESIESLVKQSKQLTERTNYLKQAGMSATSILLACNPDIQESEFVERVSKDPPCEIASIAKVFCNLDGKLSVEEMRRSLQISRIQFVHIVYHLLHNNLIKIFNDNRPRSTLVLEPRVIDNAAIQSVMMSLRRAETGLFIYPAFLYFLEQEYFRSYRARTYFSVVVFEMRQKKVVDGEVVRRVLPDKAVMEAVLRISQLKRHVDLIAHYDAFDYALLLPNTRCAGAEVFVKRIIKALTEKSLGGGVEPDELSLAFGCSSVPEDFKDLSGLLGAADLAMHQARDSQNTLVMYRDIKGRVQTAETEESAKA